VSVFAEPLAQVREALRDYRDAGDRPGMFIAGQDALAALDRVERLATDMETVLERIESYSYPLNGTLEAIMAMKEIARAVLSAREEGKAVPREGMVTVYDHEGRYVGCMGSETWRWLLEHPEVDAPALIRAHEMFTHPAHEEGDDAR
jgi:hypothetical protein